MEPERKALLSGIYAILFDIDGTLLDTFDFIYGAFDYALHLHGIEPLPRERISELMGGPLEEVYATMAPGFDRASLAEAHRVFQSENLALAALFPHTLEVLDELKNRGLKLAAITTRSLRTSVRSLEMTGIAKYFDIIISAEDVLFHKPHPEPLLKALGVLNVKPDQAVIVGDTRADIMAGKNAGTKTVAALYGFGGERLLELGPDHAIGELKELLTLV
jgi:pyrophosphatase PpaX